MRASPQSSLPFGSGSSDVQQPFGNVMHFRNGRCLKSTFPVSVAQDGQTGIRHKSL